MFRRAGVTLLEVLVSIFIMAIGMLALLTLFPIGLLSMAKAIQDDRCGNIAVTAGGLANAWDLRGTIAAPPLGSTYPPAWGTYGGDLEGGGMSGHVNWVNPFPTLPNPTGSNIPSYALYLDPNGYIINGSGVIPSPLGVASGHTPGVLRETVPYVGSDSTLAARWFTSLDDITFTPPGLAVSPPSTLVNRLSYYSWAYLIKRPIDGTSQATTTLPHLSVVVYLGRSGAPGGETAYHAQYVNSTTLNVFANTGPPLDVPALRRNTWILDVTYDPINLVHADFYRVVSVTDTAAGKTIEVTPGLKQPNVDFVVVMENVVWVFHQN